MGHVTKRVKCPHEGCGHDFDVDLEFPDVQVQPVPTPDAATQERVKELARELGEWQNGHHHHHVSDVLEGCPTCQESFRSAVDSVRGQILESVSDEEARDIAKKHGLWPPPVIRIPDNMLPERMRL